MARHGRIHDRAVLDAIEALDPESFHGTVWRITRKGREPLRGSGANGRWSGSGEFEVLYTSLERDGALAEIGYRLSLEPIWPSRIEHEIHAIRIESERLLRFSNVSSLAPFGVDVARYRTFEYGTTQAIAAAAYFLELDGLIVPNARFDCLNLIVFVDRTPPPTLIETRSVDWEDWRKQQKAAGSMRGLGSDRLEFGAGDVLPVFEAAPNSRRSLPKPRIEPAAFCCFRQSSQSTDLVSIRVGGGVRSTKTIRLRQSKRAFGTISPSSSRKYAAAAIACVVPYSKVR